MSEKPTREQIDRLWQHGLHEDNIFNNRLNFFLVFESVLLGVVAMLFGTSNPNLSIIRIIIILGIAITVVWGYIQAKQKNILDVLKARTGELDPDYKTTVQLRSQKKWPFSITWLLTYLIPALVICVWIALLFSTP